MSVFKVDKRNAKVIREIDIRGGTISNTPIGKVNSRSASFSTVSTGALTAGTITGSTLAPGTVLAGVTVRDVTAAGAISNQAGVLVLSLGSNVVYVPIYTGLA